MALQDPNIMPSSRLDCPLSLKTPNMVNPGSKFSRKRAAQLVALQLQERAVWRGCPMSEGMLPDS